MSKTLPEGTRKIILIDSDAVERNTKRRAGRTEKVLRIIVEDATGPAQIIRAMTARCVSEASIEYSQHGFVAGNQRAALVTTGAVVLDENVVEEVAEVPAPPATETAPQATTPATPAAAPATKPAKAKTDKKKDPPTE